MLKSILIPEARASVLLMKPTAYRTGPNRYRLLCNTCGDVYYVDEDAFYAVTVTIQKGLENPFCCDACTEGFHWNFAE